MDRNEKIQILKIRARILLDGVWEVPSFSSFRKYRVTWNGVGGTCECQGYIYRSWCIHLDVIKEIAPATPKEAPILDELM